MTHPAAENVMNERKVDWVAQDYGDYWVIEVRCADKPRHYTIRKSDGQMLELPHPDSPFIVNPFHVTREDFERFLKEGTE